jgi:two-component system sensor histidine kinase/response regulator
MRYVELRRHLQADYDNMLAIARLRDDVEAMTRHDLKGPLAGAIGIVQLLMDASDLDRRQGEQLRLAEQAIAAGDRHGQPVDRVVQDRNREIRIACPSRLRSATCCGAWWRPRVRPTPASSWCWRSIPISTLAPIRRLGLGDAMLTYSLLNNLIKNACEAAPERTRVIATLACRRVRCGSRSSTRV